jgi:adenosylcobyric acid synthase
VLPGTRATISDLRWLRSRGLDRAVLDHAAAGRPVLGICGGFQMLGRTVRDPDGVEGDAGAEVEGLGLLDVTTTFEVDKVLRLPVGEALGAQASGYEIHHGRITRGSGEEFLGGARAGHVFGTMWHGSLESDGLRRAFLAQASEVLGRTYEASDVSFAERRDARLDLLGDLVEQKLDVEALLELVEHGAPGDLAVLPPGLG